MLFVDFPSIDKITQTTKEENKQRIFTDNIRISNGMYRTDKEIDEYRSRVLDTELP